VATHGVANVYFERGEIVRFGENRFAKRPRDESTFRRFFDEKNNLAHRYELYQSNSRFGATGSAPTRPTAMSARW